MNARMIHLFYTGHVISVNYLFFEHVGLISGRVMRGEPSVISFSQAANGFCEQPLSEFVNGRAYKLKGYLGNLPVGEVLHRAFSLIKKPYSLIDFNCEHFVRYAHGIKIESPQMQAATIFAGIFGVLALIRT